MQQITSQQYRNAHVLTRNFLDLDEARKKGFCTIHDKYEKKTISYQVDTDEFEYVEVRYDAVGMSYWGSK